MKNYVVTKTRTDGECSEQISAEKVYESFFESLKSFSGSFSYEDFFRLLDEQLKDIENPLEKQKLMLELKDGFIQFKHDKIMKMETENIFLNGFEKRVPTQEIQENIPKGTSMPPPPSPTTPPPPPPPTTPPNSPQMLIKPVIDDVTRGEIKDIYDTIVQDLKETNEKRENPEEERE